MAYFQQMCGIVYVFRQCSELRQSHETITSRHSSKLINNIADSHTVPTSTGNLWIQFSFTTNIYSTVCCKWSIAPYTTTTNEQPRQKHSWLLLSRPRLSRIITYPEVKILSLLKHENLATGKKYCWKEEKLLLRSNFSSFQHFFSIYL